MRDDEKDESPVVHSPLTSLHEAGMVAKALSHPLGVREFSQRSGEEALLGVLHERRLMLTLDNGAHVLPGRAIVYKAIHLWCDPASRVSADQGDERDDEDDRADQDALQHTAGCRRGGLAGIAGTYGWLRRRGRLHRR